MARTMLPHNLARTTWDSPPLIFFLRKRRFAVTISTSYIQSRMCRRRRLCHSANRSLQGRRNKRRREGGRLKVIQLDYVKESRRKGGFIYCTQRVLGMS
jgi:hypothetical protein